MELDADLDPHFKVCGSDTLPGKRAGSEGIWTPGKDYLGVFLEVNALLVQFIIKSIIFIFFYIFLFRMRHQRIPIHNPFIKTF